MNDDRREIIFNILLEISRKPNKAEMVVALYYLCWNWTYEEMKQMDSWLDSHKLFKLLFFKEKEY